MATGNTGGARSRAQTRGRRNDFVLTVRVDGANETIRALRDLPKDASDALRDASRELSEDIAAKVRAAGMAQGRQAKLVAMTVKARRDRLPFIVVGGAKKVGRAYPKNGRASASDLLFGSEFGALRSEGRKYSPFGYAEHAGKRGLWIFPTVEAHQAEISAAWNEAADEIIRRFSQDGA